MSIRLLDNNWMKPTSFNYGESEQENLMLRVLSKLKSGAEFFNKSTITGQFRRPSQTKYSCQKLPELTKRNTTEISMTLHQVRQNDMNKTLQTYGRISVLKQQNSEFNVKNRLKSSQGKRQFNLTRYTLKKQKYGTIEMKGVVFRKKNLQKRIQLQK